MKVAFVSQHLLPKHTFSYFQCSTCWKTKTTHWHQLHKISKLWHPTCPVNEHVLKASLECMISNTNNQQKNGPKGFVLRLEWLPGDDHDCCGERYTSVSQWEEQQSEHQNKCFVKTASSSAKLPANLWRGNCCMMQQAPWYTSLFYRAIDKRKTKDEDHLQKAKQLVYATCCFFDRAPSLLRHFLTSSLTHLSQHQCCSDHDGG